MGSDWIQTQRGGGYQCTELAYRYMHFRWQIDYRHGDAREWCDGDLPSTLVKSTTPSHGDLIVFDSRACGADATTGHIAVVDVVDASGSKVTLVEENRRGATANTSCPTCFLHAVANDGSSSGACSGAGGGGGHATSGGDGGASPAGAPATGGRGAAAGGAGGGSESMQAGRGGMDMPGGAGRAAGGVGAASGGAPSVGQAGAGGSAVAKGGAIANGGTPGADAGAPSQSAAGQGQGAAGAGATGSQDRRGECTLGTRGGRWLCHRAARRDSIERFALWTLGHHVAADCAAGRGRSMRDG
jgi:surface antigen